MDAIGILYTFTQKKHSDLYHFMYMGRDGGAEVERSPRKRKVGCSKPGHDKPKSLKQVVTVPLPNARHRVRMSRVLGDDLKNG